MDIDSDFICTSAAPIDYTTFPSILSSKNFNFTAYSAQVSALEEFALDEPLVFQQAPMPAVKDIIAAEKEVYNTVGDRRFSGLKAYEFLHTRYKVLDTTDSMSSSNTSVLLASACDSEGFPYTIYIPNSATYYDSNNANVVLPAFDKYGKLVTFPLKDIHGRYVLTNSALTAIDDKGEMIFFPLKDTNNKKIEFPFRGVTGDVIIVPPRNQDRLLDVTEAYTSLDTAYSNAKDADAFAFAKYIISLSNTNRTSFFYNTVAAPGGVSGRNIIPFFAAAMYDLTATNTDLTDITADSLNYIVRYYPDRAVLAYEYYKELGGTGPYTTITPLTGSSFSILIRNENVALASYNILSSPLWSPEAPLETYFNNSIPPNNVHTSILELHNTGITNAADIVTLNAQVTTLSAMVTSLSSQLLALSAQYLATDTKVTYNSGIIDTLRTTVNWPAIWVTPAPGAGFTPPPVPAAR